MARPTNAPNPYDMDTQYERFLEYAREQMRREQAEYDKTAAMDRAKDRMANPEEWAQRDAAEARWAQKVEAARVAEDIRDRARWRQQYEKAVARHGPVGLGGLFTRAVASPFVFLDTLGSAARGEESQGLSWFLNQPPQPGEYAPDVIGIPREESTDMYGQQFAKGGIANLQVKAEQLQRASRYPDTTLVHMAPNEIAALRKVAFEQYGTDLPRNPKTGLYEAGILSSLLGAGVGFFTANPYLGAAVAGLGTKATGGTWGQAFMDAFGAYGMGSGIGEAAAQGAATEGVAGASGATQAGMEEATKVAGAKGAGIATGLPADVGAAATQNLAGNPNAASLINEQYLRYLPPDGANFSQKIGSANMGSMIDASYGMAPSAPTTPPAPMTPMAPTRTYADLSGMEKLKYAGQRAMDKPWDFISKDIGATPSSLIAIQGMQALQEPPKTPEKRPNRFYQYDFDPLTGAFSNPRMTPRPYWAAAKGGMAGGLDSLDAAYAQLDEMEAAMSPGYAQGGRMLRGNGDGTSDGILALIDGQQPAALSDGEFVVPARVVAELGNGSSDAGARKLQAMLSRVEALGREAKRGSDSNAERHLPA